MATARTPALGTAAALLALSLLVLCSPGCSDTGSSTYDFDEDGSPDGEDCGPADPNIHPGADDALGDDIDNNCDGVDGVDSDGDGHPVPLDCDDSDPAIHPDAEDPFEDEGDIDDNCDGIDGIDGDGDGFAGDRPLGDPLRDCDDENAAVHPSATEDPSSPLDENCDGIGADFDGDGFETPEDCNDDPNAGGASVYPGATEICNELDEDCDGLIDEDENGQPAFDSDGDGWNSCSECDDGLDSVHPEATEVCDGVDNDCDELIDEDTTEGTPGSCLCPYNFGGASCREIRDEGRSQGSGIYIVQPELSPAPYSVYCDMEAGDGGWTLALISSDDEQQTWTMTNSAWMGSIPVEVGDECDLQPSFATALDYKSLAYNQQLFTDLLFIHHSASGGQGFETWAQYDAVGNNQQSIGTFTAQHPFPDCSPLGYPMTAGNLMVAGTLCSTDLFFNVGDTYYSDPADVCPAAYSSFGPTWQRAYLGFCAPSYFLNPGEYSSLGPCTGWAGHTERPGRGFGLALNINVGVPDSGEDHIRMYVR